MLPLIAESVAEIVVVPTALPVAKPAELIWATVVDEDPHVTWVVRF